MMAIPATTFGPFMRAVPVVVIVVLSAPAWLTWPFLSQSRQQVVLQMVDALARWTKGEPLAIAQQDAEPRPLGTCHGDCECRQQIGRHTQSR